MDPYVEQHHLWPDFHDELLGEIKRQLAISLPSHYVARTGKRSYVVLAEADGKEGHPFVPDVGVTSVAQRRTPSASEVPADPSVRGGPISMLALIDEQYRENFIEIYHTESDQRLVTVIEVLSPANKRKGTKGWNVYQRKRKALLLGAAHLVEIDLLCGGDRMPMVSSWPDSPYYLLTCRKERAPYCSVWPASFHERLPTIDVPLEEPDPDLALDLQPMVDAIYDRSRYGQSIDYSKPLALPIPEAQKGWLKEHVPTAVKTTGSRRRKRT
jgi:hypothetical protein